MLLALSNKISAIDRFADEQLGISLYTLMGRSGAAVASAVRERVPSGASVVILCGKGNNGGDGYATAVHLMDDYTLTVFDVFGAGQRSDEGRAYMTEYTERGGTISPFTPTDATAALLKNADCIIDAVFGTGYHGEPPDEIRSLARMVNESVRPTKIAIDVPMGINADNGSVDIVSAVSVSATVALSFVKPGLVSFPAKAHVGHLVHDDLGIPADTISGNFDFHYFLVDRALARELLPVREENGSKGSFGKLLVITGSDKYRGAAALSLSAALRGGVGYTTYLGTPALTDSLSTVYPEAIYKPYPAIESITDAEISEIVELSRKMNATLVGSGSGSSDGLLRLVRALLDSEGGPLILDADAINVLADIGAEGRGLLHSAKRPVVITPHPLEFARLSGNTVSDVQLHRLEAAKKFAAEHHVVLALKGAATVVTDGTLVYINSSGSSALSKAGSGDVLAGFLASMCAAGSATENGISHLDAAALSVYVHGAAADSLSSALSAFSVTPSDLPVAMGRELATLSGD